MAIMEVDMSKRFSIAEARDQFTSIVRDVEKTSAVEITRRGKPVVVLLSWREYQRLTSDKNFWERYSAFRDQFDLAKLEIDPEVFEGVRDPSPGRQVNL
jgi:prevent-host-death family protein